MHKYCCRSNSFASDWLIGWLIDSLIHWYACTDQYISNSKTTSQAETAWHWSYTSKQDLLATLENRNHTKDCKVADTHLVCWLTVCLAQNQHSKALFIIAGRGGRGLVWGDEWQSCREEGKWLYTRRWWDFLLPAWGRGWGREIKRQSILYRGSWYY